MARKSEPISRAEPGTDRNRTRLKVPATATPAPMLPFTMMMITVTMAGSRASVVTKLAEERPDLEWTKARKTPMARAAAMQATNDPTATEPLDAVESKMQANRLGIVGLPLVTDWLIAGGQVGRHARDQVEPGAAIPEPCDPLGLARALAGEVGLAHLGERNLVEAVRGEEIDQPERDGPGGLDLHEGLALPEEGMAVGPVGNVEQH
ncbi:MAG: hypothetical protein WAY93_08175 [Atopobiaceae bacterium]